MSRIAALGAAAIILFPLTLSASQAPPPAAGVGKAPAETPANVTFNHKTDTVRIYDLDLENGQQFIVEIGDTCPDEFDYPYVGVERGGPAGMSPQGEGGKKPLSKHRIAVVYDDRYGGYIFAIVRKAGVVAGSKCQAGEELNPVSFIVSVREQEWGISFSGGFTFSGLTSPVFGLQTDNNIKKIVEEPDKRDKLKLGAASFVHVFHDSMSWKGLQPALAFGLGINSDNKSEYFAGLGLRLGDKATLSTGLAVGSIARLPNGITKDAPVTDDNLLNNLGSAVVRRWFFALSYSFIDTKDRLKKPFAAEPAAATGSANQPAAGQKPASPEAAAVVEALAKAADTFAAIPEMKGVAICGATAKPGDGNTLAVTLEVKDTSKLPKPIDNLAKTLTEALTARLKTNIPVNTPTLKPAITIVAGCK